MLQVRHARAAGALAFLALPVAARAQQPDSARTTRPDSAAAPAKEPERKLDLSGIVFANFSYRGDAAARSANRFDLERAYLTVRAPLGGRASVRVTTDVFQQQRAPDDDYYRGWSVRAKYAYLQYDWLKGGAGELSGWARLGMLQTVTIEHIESFWPRWISNTAVERWGYFASADLGAAAQLSLPNELGEVYATVTNGPGYTSRETDRFKDYGARLSITPLAGREAGLLGSLTLTTWGYRGALASRFVEGGAGQVGPVGSSLRRDRYGALVAIRDRRLTALAELSERRDEGEAGDNTPASPRAVADSTGRLLSAFAIVRPLEIARPERRSPLALFLRVDRFEPNADEAPHGRLVIAGVMLDVTSRLSLSLDYQEQLPRGGAPYPELKTYFLHVVASY